MSRALVLLFVLVLAPACASPVGIVRMSPEEVHRSLTANAISTGGPSAYADQLLQRWDLRERFASDPAAALADLHATLPTRGAENRLFALAELSFLHAEATGGRPYYLAAALYAYAFLFPGDAASRPDPLDPRERIAADLYNRGLAEGLASADGQEVVLASGRHALPFGELEIELADDGLVWAGRRLEGFVPAARFGVYGLRNRYRQAGLGAPLVARLGPPAAGTLTPAHSRVPPRLGVPVTAVLQLEHLRPALTDGHVRGRLGVYSMDADRTVDIDGRKVPLEFEPSAALAHTLSGARVWDTEIRGFLSGDYLLGAAGHHLYTMTPYRRGRVPIVLVHGTASSPGRWADLVNELESDPRIGPRCQFWLFVYHTGNPLLYSGGLLSDALQQTVRELDPDGSDPALHRMIVVGHSQGGLLTKLTVVDSGSRFWDNVSSSPFEALRVTAETRALLRRSIFFERLPFVDRVIFMATPHRGSDVAGFLTRWLRGLLYRVVTLPGNMLTATGEVLAGSDDPRIRLILQDGLPRSVDNMSPGNRAIRTLADLRLAPGVKAHSIIAVRAEGPPEQGGDGVVTYHSAHLDEAVSERVVRSGHSVQSNPQAIEEVRRIVLEHLDGR